MRERDQYWRGFADGARWALSDVHPKSPGAFFLHLPGDRDVLRVVLTEARQQARGEASWYGKFSPDSPGSIPSGATFGELAGAWEALELAITEALEGTDPDVAPGLAALCVDGGD